MAFPLSCYHGSTSSVSLCLCDCPEGKSLPHPKLLQMVPNDFRFRKLFDWSCTLEAGIFDLDFIAWLEGGLSDVSGIRFRLITLESASSIWFVSGLASLPTISQNYHVCGVLFSLVAQSADITVNIHALWICLDRFRLVAQFYKIGREIDTRVNRPRHNISGRSVSRTRFRKIYGGRGLAFEVSGSVLCYSRGLAGLDFAYFSLLHVALERKHRLFLVRSCDMSCHAHPNVIAGSTADRPAGHSMADLGRRLDTTATPTCTQYSLNRLYEEEYRSVVPLKTRGGLAAALVLRGNGITVRLIERLWILRSVRDNGIQPRILELLGLAADIFDDSIEPPQMRAYDGKPVIRTWDFGVKEPATPAVPYPNPQILGGSTMEAILRSHLSRLVVTVDIGTELVDFTQDAHKVIANLLKRDKNGSSENETLEVDWVIGAGGA
ncbi:hypothetical protein BS47DRAFT_1368999 [Hydnum rufescens UP504]|uniref:FAD-binding domain-containing protein n=1 Tax=Hydnum rufescens UP504 TaxID=1448309 RepID=A0A9P6AEJ4_9AGAM|nr:hypothetical protein BS47DRAFT_1368999 [Hydnum rufescens UP504]